jgi:phosphate transport system substrate-binding protein
LRTHLLAAVIAVLALSLVAAGCGGDSGGSGGETIVVDGSSTVGPLITAAAEGFRDESEADVTVGISGTGGGFERFCVGETDLSNASRPIKDEEATICDENGVEYVEFQVANDALTVVVNPDNDWATCLTVDELAKMWGTDSKVNNWSQVRDGFPDVPLRLFGAGTDSGTFDYFTDAINGDEGVSRSDYSASEDDNVTVQGVKGTKGGLGYFGFSYFEENAESLRAVEIDGGDGCVAPSIVTAQDGSYAPLARPLFVYAKKSSFERQEVEDFIKYIFDNQAAIAERAQFVPLNPEQLAEQQQKFEDALAEVGS